MTNTSHATDGRVIAAEHELTVLLWLDQFGALSSRQLGRLVWPDGRQAMSMAQRTLRRLLKKRQILERRLHTGGRVCELGEGGAKRLRQEGYEVDARGTRDLRMKHPYHRTLANEIAIAALLTGQVVWSEYEIQTNRAPFRELYSRIPDVLIQEDPVGSDTLTWVEVENSYKSQTRLRALIDVAEILLGQRDGYRIDDDHCIDRMAFAVPNGPAERAVLRAVMDRWDAEELSERAFDRLWLWRCRLTPRLRWGGVYEQLSVEAALP